MDLDKFEIDEFDNQYLNTYLLHDGKLVRVRGKASSKAVVVQDYVENKQYEALIKDLVLFNPEAGYYDLKHPNLKHPLSFYIYREPVGRVQRGVSERNIYCQFPMTQENGNFTWVDAAKYIARYDQVFLSCLEERPKDLKATFKEFVGLRQFITRLDNRKLSTSLALSQSICAVKSKWGYVTFLHHKQPIAFYLDDVIHLNKDCTLHREQLEELNIGVVK